MNQDLLQKIINLNLEFINSDILPLIEKDYARAVAIEVVERLKQTVIALTDDNSANKEQINAIWGSITSDPEIVLAVRNALTEAISKIKDPKIKVGLTSLITPVTQTLTAVLDKVKPDNEQLEKIWKDYLDSPEFLTLVVSNIGWILSKIIKDKNAILWIERIITAFLVVK